MTDNHNSWTHARKGLSLVNIIAFALVAAGFIGASAGRMYFIVLVAVGAFSPVSCGSSDCSGTRMSSSAKFL